MAAPQAQPIIIKKKRGGHAGAHGGAWKVAYADFVTAMMALFIVLWLLNSSEKVQQAVAGYFTDPTGKGTQPGNSLDGSGADAVSLKAQDMVHLKEKIQAAFQKVPEIRKLEGQVQMTVTVEGLRIELLESEGGTFFDSGSASPTETCRTLLRNLASELGGLSNSLLLEGHTDARPYAGSTSYSNWELAADRANTARRLMQQSGIRPAQVSQVRGYADRQLRLATDKFHPSNRRVSILVQSQPDEGGTKGKTASPTGHAKTADSHGKPSSVPPETKGHDSGHSAPSPKPAGH